MRREVMILLLLGALLAFAGIAVTSLSGAPVPEMRPGPDSLKINYSSSTFQIIATFYPDGRIELGEEYKDQPQKAARDFVEALGHPCRAEAR